MSEADDWPPPQRRRRPPPHPTYSEVYEPLLRALEGVRIESAPVVLAVRCGVDKGRGRRCGAPIGDVIDTPKGLAWRPGAHHDLASGAPGQVPMLLPSTTPDQRFHFCEVLQASCGKGHSWGLAVAELTRRVQATSRAPYYVERATPDRWGPLVDDPADWTDAELLQALEVLVRQVAGVDPIDGTTVATSKAESRATVLTHLLDGRSPYLDRRPRVVARLRSLGAVQPPENNV